MHNRCSVKDLLTSCMNSLTCKSVPVHQRLTPSPPHPHRLHGKASWCSLMVPLFLSLPLTLALTLRSCNYSHRYGTVSSFHNFVKLNPPKPIQEVVLTQSQYHHHQHHTHPTHPPAESGSFLGILEITCASSIRPLAGNEFEDLFSVSYMHQTLCYM